MKSEEIKKTKGNMLEYATFYVDDLLIGIDIQQAQEINRHLETTDVPHAPEYVRGVVNLRGEVVTVLDLRTLLELEPKAITDSSCNVIVNYENEQVGLLVDGIGDVVIANGDEIEDPPANISGVDGRYFKGIYKLEKDLLVILDVEKTLFIDADREMNAAS